MSETPLDESLNPIWVLLSRGESPNLWMPPTGGKGLGRLAGVGVGRPRR